MSRGTYILALFLALVMLVIPVAFFAALPNKQNAYYLSRIIGASLSVAVAAFAAVIGLAQYKRNSREKRIERSMSFWQRSNSEPFMEHFRQLVKHWANVGTENLCDIAESDVEKLQIKLSIEHVLDFYDEACTAILMGACDEEAMYSYLGPLMLQHADRLSVFIDKWRKRHQRQEKWDCFTVVMNKWKTKEFNFKQLWRKRIGLMDKRAVGLGG